MMKNLISIFLILFPYWLVDTDIVKPTTHVISIGIDNYSNLNVQFRNCVSDSRSLINQIKKDNSSWEIMQGTSISFRNSKNIHAYHLINEKATLDTIVEVFKKVAISAKPVDNFIFYFAGFTEEYFNTKDGLRLFSHELTEAIFISPGKLHSALEFNNTEPFLKQFGSHEEGKGDFILIRLNEN